MDEAEQLCDRLVIVSGGEIAAEGSPRELIRRYSTREVSNFGSSTPTINITRSSASTARPIASSV